PHAVGGGEGARAAGEGADHLDQQHVDVAIAAPELAEGGGADEVRAGGHAEGEGLGEGAAELHLEGGRRAPAVRAVGPVRPVCPVCPVRAVGAVGAVGPVRPVGGAPAVGARS
ncbi:MAG: hypothetical protein ACK559_38705, partial [bacterium]